MDNFIFKHFSRNNVTDSVIKNYKTITTFYNNNTTKSIFNIKKSLNKNPLLLKQKNSNENIGLNFNLLDKKSFRAKGSSYLPVNKLLYKRPNITTKNKKQKVFSFDSHNNNKTAIRFGFMTRANRDMNNLLLKKNYSIGKSYYNYNNNEQRKKLTSRTLNNNSNNKLIDDYKEFVDIIGKKIKNENNNKKSYKDLHNKKNKFLDIVINRILHRISFINTKNEVITEEYVMNLLFKEAEKLKNEIDNMLQKECNIKQFSKVMKSHNKPLCREEEKIIFFPFINSFSPIPQYHYKTVKTQPNLTNNTHQDNTIVNETTENKINKCLHSKLTTLRDIQEYSHRPYELLIKGNNNNNGNNNISKNSNKNINNVQHIQVVTQSETVCGNEKPKDKILKEKVITNISHENKVDTNNEVAKNQFYTTTLTQINDVKQEPIKVISPQKAVLTKIMKNKYLFNDANKITLPLHKRKDVKSLTLFNIHSKQYVLIENDDESSISIIEGVKSNYQDYKSNRKQTRSLTNKVNIRDIGVSYSKYINKPVKEEERNLKLILGDSLNESNDSINNFIPKEETTTNNPINNTRIQKEQILIKEENKNNKLKKQKHKQKAIKKNQDLVNLKAKLFPKNENKNEFINNDNNNINLFLSKSNSNSSDISLKSKRGKNVKNTKVIFTTEPNDEQISKKQKTTQTTTRRKSSKYSLVSTPRNTSIKSLKNSNQNSIPRSKKSNSRNSSMKLKYQTITKSQFRTQKTQFSTKQTIHHEFNDSDDSESNLDSDLSEKKYLPNYKAGRVSNYLKEQQIISTLFELSQKTIGEIPTKENIDLLFKYDTFVKQFVNIKEDFANSSEYANYKVMTLTDKELVYYLLLERNKTLKHRLRNGENLIGSILETINKQKQAKDDLIRRTTLLNRQSKESTRSYFIDEPSSVKASFRREIKKIEHVDKTKFIQSYLSAKNEIALQKEIKFQIYTTQNNTSKEKFLQFLRQMENLKKLDPENYIKQLEENYDFYKEGLNELVGDREMEDRINKFVFFFGRDRERDKNTRIILNNRCKVKDGKPDFNIEENIIEDNN